MTATLLRVEGVGLLCNPFFRLEERITADNLYFVNTLGDISGTYGRSLSVGTQPRVSQGFGRIPTHRWTWHR